MNGRERSNVGVKWQEERKKRRDRLTGAQDEEGRLKGRSAQPTGQLKRQVGCYRGVEGGQLHGKVANGTEELYLHTAPLLSLKGGEGESA